MVGGGWMRAGSGALVAAVAVIGLGGCSTSDLCGFKAPPDSARGFLQAVFCRDALYVIEGPFPRLEVPQLEEGPGRRPAVPGEVVRFDASGSVGSNVRDADGSFEFGGADIDRYEWDLDGDPGFEIDGGTPTAERAYGSSSPEEREIPILLRATDAAGLTAVATTTITVGSSPPPPPENRAPTAAFTAAPNPAPVGEVVRFDASASSDPDGDPLRYAWDLDGDPGNGFEIDSGSDPVAERRYETPGEITVSLRVSDGSTVGSASQELRITVSDEGPPGNRSREAASASPGRPGRSPEQQPKRSRRARPFTAHVTRAKIIDPGKGLDRDGYRLLARDIRLRGALQLRLSGPDPSRLSRSVVRWKARVDLGLDVSTGKRWARGVGLARLKGRRLRPACLRVRMRAGDAGVFRGRFRALGRPGPARRGSFRAPIGRGTITGKTAWSAPRGSVPRRCRALVR